ncbi:MAG: phosphoribosyltransferase [Xenococcaceae cyanobacterium]
MSITALFRDRFSAGEQLAELIFAEISQIKSLGIWASPIVYAIPRGGIPVAVPVASKLGCPLDVIVAKKITPPTNRELAIGAVTTHGNVLWTQRQLLVRISFRMLKAARHQAQEKAEAQWSQFCHCRPGVSSKGAIAILVDDGIATGMTMAAAVEAMRSLQAAQVWICAPVAPQDLIAELQQWGDRVVVLETPHPFLNVSRFYRQFPQVETEEALANLQQHNQQLLSFS